MNFKTWLSFKEEGVPPRLTRPKKPVAGAPVEEDLYRIIKGQFTPEEKVLVNKQRQELKKYGVVFTPFKFYGGMENPQPSIPPFEDH